MEAVILYGVLLCIGVVVFNFVMDLAYSIGDDDMPWWLKYTVAIVIFVALASVEIYLGNSYL